MRIAVDFEGGRIDTVSVKGTSARLSIPPDPENVRFRQWFAFRATGARGERASFVLENAGECTWAKGFAGYRVFASDDGATWKRIPTSFDGKALSFRHSITTSRVTFAYFPPYPVAAADALIERAVRAGGRLHDLAETQLGARIRLVALGRPEDDAPSVWVIAQQHPGEAMAGWFMEGFVSRLCDRKDLRARRLLARATVLVVPRMNPDGCALGNHRTNAAGLDLNRQWEETPDEAPEVAGVRAAMADRGVDVFLDIHGDETIPHLFAQGAGGIPSRTDEHEARDELFFSSLLEASRDFQTKEGYPADAPGEANLAIASNAVAEQHGALSMTIEMPFTKTGGPKGRDWTPERAVRFGRSAVDALGAYAERAGWPPVVP